MGRSGGGDLDLTTDARPERIRALLAPHCDALWDTGIRFGTVGGCWPGTRWR